MGLKVNTELQVILEQMQEVVSSVRPNLNAKEAKLS